MSTSLNRPEARRFCMKSDTAVVENAVPLKLSVLPFSSMPVIQRSLGMLSTKASRNLSGRPWLFVSSPMTWTRWRSEEHTSELQSRLHLVCRLLLEKKKTNKKDPTYTRQQTQQCRTSTEH